MRPLCLPLCNFFHRISSIVRGGSGTGLPGINVNVVVAKPPPGGWKAADIARLERTVSQLEVQLDAVKQTLKKAKMDVGATPVDTPPREAGAVAAVATPTTATSRPNTRARAAAKK